MSISLPEFIIAALVIINIAWSQLLCRKINRLLNITFENKYDRHKNTF